LEPPLLARSRGDLHAKGTQSLVGADLLLQLIKQGKHQRGQSAQVGLISNVTVRQCVGHDIGGAQLVFNSEIKTQQLTSPLVLWDLLTASGPTRTLS
jgi:hypothetical protein